MRKSRTFQHPAKRRGVLFPSRKKAVYIPVRVLVGAVLERQRREAQSVRFAHVVLILANVAVTF